MQRQEFFPEVSQARIGECAVPSVNARDLHETLHSQKDFSNWIKNRIRTYGFEEGKDYRKINQTGEKLNHAGSGAGNGQVIRKPRTEYLLTIDMGKELAMVERTERGRLVRQYFIQVEERTRELMSQSVERERLRGARSMATLMKRAKQSGKSERFINDLIRYRQMGLAQREAAKLLDVCRETVQDYEKLLKDCGYHIEPASQGGPLRRCLEVV